MGRERFELPKPEATDLQSARFSHLPTYPFPYSFLTIDAGDPVGPARLSFRLVKDLSIFAGVEGLEPTTHGLTVRCSEPTELHSHIFQKGAQHFLSSRWLVANPEPKTIDSTISFGSKLMTSLCLFAVLLHLIVFQITLRARGDSNPRMSVLQTDVLAASPLAHIKPNEIVVLQSPGTSLLHSSTVIAPKPLGFSGFACFITRFLYRFPENFLQR